MCCCAEHLRVWSCAGAQRVSCQQGWEVAGAESWEVVGHRGLAACSLGCSRSRAGAVLRQSLGRDVGCECLSSLHGLWVGDAKAWRTRCGDASLMHMAQTDEWWWSYVVMERLGPLCVWPYFAWYKPFPISPYTFVTTYGILKVGSYELWVPLYPLLPAGLCSFAAGLSLAHWTHLEMHQVTLVQHNVEGGVWGRAAGCLQIGNQRGERWKLVRAPLG